MQPTFFDEQFRLEKLSKLNDPLSRLTSHVDFEFFRDQLEEHCPILSDSEKGGRPPFDRVMMFKILLLQRLYNISDDRTEFAILDRLSFMRFLGLGLADRVPDAKTIWHFRDQLAQSDVVEKLFEMLYRQLDQDGVVLHKGSIVDASIVEVPRQRNSREENKVIKEGGVPEEWHENQAKLRQKDTDARWVQKNKVNYFGYKNHIKTDQKSGLISRYHVTPANEHDSTALGKLLDEQDKGHRLFADSAYRSADIEKELKKQGICSRIHKKGYRNSPLSEEDKEVNTRKSKIRACVEHVFGFMTNSMKLDRVLARSQSRAETVIGLNNLAYNLMRLPHLKVNLAT